MEQTGLLLSKSTQSVLSWDQMAVLEHHLAKYAGAAHCVNTASGTQALLLALRAAGVDNGDSVLCTSFGFLATAEIISLAGAAPLLVDINPNTFCMDPYCLEYVLKKCVRTEKKMPKALIASDLFGLPCQFDAIAAICAQYDITLIEDLSGAFGASFQGKKAGNFGRFSVASFFPSKPLGNIGDGGGIFCRNSEDAGKLRALRDRCNPPEAVDLAQAAVIAEKLTVFEDELARKQVVAARYRDNLSGFVKTQQIPPQTVSAYTQFVISLVDKAQRESVIDALREKHIPCSILQAVHGRGAFEWERVVLANTQAVEQRLLAIPMHAYLTNRVIDYICQCIMETVSQ